METNPFFNEISVSVRARTVHPIVDAAMMRRELISSRPPLSVSTRASKLDMVGAHVVLVSLRFGAAPLDQAALFVVLCVPQVCQPGFWAQTPGAADAAPVVPLKELSAVSLTHEVLPLTQQEVGAVVLELLLVDSSTDVPPVFFRAKAPHDSTVVRHRYGSAARPAELGQSVRILEAGTSMAPSRMLGTRDVLVRSSPASHCTDAATPWFVHKFKAALFPSDSTWSQVGRFVVRVIRAVSAPCTGGAAAIAHISHEQPMPRNQQQTVLAVYGVTAASHAHAHAASAATSTSTSHPLLLIQQQAELLQLHVLTDHLLLSDLQLLELLEVESDLFAHDAGAVAAQALPLPGHPLAFLAVIIQEAAEVPQLTVVFMKLLIYVLKRHRKNNVGLNDSCTETWTRTHHKA